MFVPEWSTIWLFLAAGVVLVIVPGPNVLYIVTRSVHQGRSAGVVSALGVETATLLHVAAATLGLSAILASSAMAFSVVKFAGAAYLIYIGVRTLLSRDHAGVIAAPAPMDLSRIFWQGMVINALNPKTALFFLAFLPQFVDPARGSIGTQTLILGCLLALLGLTSDVLYALAAGSAGAWLKGNGRFQAAERWVSGTVYIGLGVTTAFAGTESRR
jgi:threonine/homoserine/homoserine lactone efflux protein